MMSTRDVTLQVVCIFLIVLHSTIFCTSDLCSLEQYHIGCSLIIQQLFAVWQDLRATIHTTTHAPCTLHVLDSVADQLMIVHELITRELIYSTCTTKQAIEGWKTCMHHIGDIAQAVYTLIYDDEQSTDVSVCLYTDTAQLSLTIYNTLAIVLASQPCNT
jgi:hypothetical protein